MKNSDPISVEIPREHLWHGQLPHLLLLAGLLPGVWAIAGPALGDGQWLGVSDRWWCFLALAVPIVHQLVVALIWRAQLTHQVLTRAFGDLGFVVWGVLFMPLLIARPFLVFGLGMADRGSLHAPATAAMVIGTLMLLPAVWAMHSVAKYFGIPRALGGDHFFERYRTMPFVREGAFKYSSNAMYTFVFIGLWGIALILRSQAAFAVVLFQHAYIWVHWYCTEQPDCVVLYGRSPDDQSK